MAKLKPLVVVCVDAAAAARLVEEYEYIGAEAFRRGRFVTVMPWTW